MAGTEEIEETTDISRTKQSGEKILQMKKSICAPTHFTSINSTPPTSIYLSLQSPCSNIAQENLQFWRIWELNATIPKTTTAYNVAGEKYKPQLTNFMDVMSD
ncbi:Uncharacterized protein Fot_18899 [Forsythia ovata]|uniref:Uncharacterized protein n=1 Tax=Forsythia ovata TaxID=205694 RepID=A0ABD1VJL5_9LAMI